jgi:hypothetical protein
MAALIPCAGCARHVRSDESECPFCARPLDAACEEAEAPRPARRLGRAATFAFGAALAASAAGCSESHDGRRDSGTPRDAGPDSGAIAPPYGAPPDDGGAPMPLYGGAPGD